MSQLGLGMEYDDDHGRRGPRRRGAGAIAVVVSLVLLGLVAGLAVFGIKALTGSSSDFTGDGSGNVTVVVKKGDTLTAIGRTLADAGVVASVDAFVGAASADQRASSIAPGTYVLHAKMSGEAAVALMLDPSSRAVEKVVIPEGWRLEKILAATSRATGISQDELKDSLSRAGSLGLPAYAEGNVEGFLFPATYEFEPKSTADDVVKAMLERFAQASKDLELVKLAKARGLTPLQAVTMASIVELEAAPDDYDKVARVLYNRLDKGMRLQVDSTVNYALGTSVLQLSAEQLATDSPYNTYKVKGLPPGPIGSPGEAALQAVLNPAKGSWLYFVTTDPKNKTTEFATTYAQFLALKKKYQANVG